MGDSGLQQQTNMQDSGMQQPTSMQDLGLQQPAMDPKCSQIQSQHGAGIDTRLPWAKFILYAKCAGYGTAAADDELYRWHFRRPYE